MHMYDVVGYQGGGHRLSDRAENSTCFDDKEEYMSLHGSQQEELDEYQAPQWCARDTRAAVISDEVIEPPDSHVQKDKLKQMRRYLCILSLLVVILILKTILSLSLSAYGLYSIGSSAIGSHIQQGGNASLSNMIIWLENNLNVTNKEICQLKRLITTLDTRINATNMQVVNLVPLQSAVNMIESRVNITSREVGSLTSLRATVNKLESQLTTVNAEAVSQRTFINSLESQFNTTNAEVISQRSSVNTLNSPIEWN